MADFITYFSIIPDPRIDRCKKYPLLEILFLCMAAGVSGAEGWEEIEDFGEQRLEWLRQFLPYKRGIPSHDTIARVMSRLDTKVLQQCFIAWIQDVVVLSERTVVAIDGKTVRRSFQDGDRKSAIHVVNAWACENQVSLGQLKVDGKSNEIKAIPELLSLLAIKGCIITIDAMGCQTAIAEQITSKKADYVLAVKDNQPELKREIVELFDLSPEELEHSEYETVEKDHGRIETRYCRQIRVDSQWLPSGARWKGIKSVIKITGRREQRASGETSEESRYFISSLETNAQEAWAAVRKHWRVENSLHWSLDVSMREDDCRIRRDNGAEFFAVVRRLSMNIIKKDTSKKAGINRKRKIALMNPDYHLQIMRQFGDI